jgi:RHS repeat-associated protein
MKNFYYTLIFFGFNLFISAQTTTPTGSSTEVGITEGQLTVSLSGGANYAIPIAMPPGINGVVPQISLIYNSQGNNGIAGYGWNISGVSAITRIPSTKFHDGVIDPVDFDNLDRFAFDGQRLIVKNGIYGENGTVYETENFSNVKITSYGVHSNGANYGPEYFIVEYPDGSKAYYGNLTISRSITDWAITYWENLQGVRISYNYTLADNNLDIASVKYGNLSTNASINEVQFVYKTRVRPEQAYIGGENLIKNTILSEIKVIGNNIGFRNYVLAHDITSLGYERLTSINEKSGDDAKSYNPTVFEYETTDDNASVSPIISSIVTTSVKAPGYDPDKISDYYSASISGEFGTDGKSDLLLFDPLEERRGSYCLINDVNSNKDLLAGTKILIGGFEHIFTTNWVSGDAIKGYKMMPNQGWCIAKTDNVTDVTTFSMYSKNTTNTNPATLEYSFDYIFPSYCWVSSTSEIILSSRTNKSYLTGDFNGDGITDAIVIERGAKLGGRQPPCKSNDIRYTSTSDPSSGKVYFVNLDKRVNSNQVNFAGTIMESVPGFSLNFNSYPYQCQISSGDFDGDGKTDIFVKSKNIVDIYTLGNNNQIKKIQTITLPLDKYGGITGVSGGFLDLGDYNGDGKTDLGPLVLSTGSSYTVIPDYTNNGLDITGKQFDYNNDGKTDFLAKTGNGTASNLINFIGTVNKRAFEYSQIHYITNQSIIPDFTFDIRKMIISSNLRSKNQIGFIDYEYKKIRYLTINKDFSKEKLLKSITIGNGVKEIITYSSLINANGVYTSAEQIENYPNTDIVIAPSFQVVSKLEKQSATVYKKQLFFYNGAVSNTEGLGFLGFRSTVRTNWHDDITTIISCISKFDVSQRGANTENYTVLGLHAPLITTGYQTPRIIVKDGGYTVTSIDNLTATQNIILKPNTWIKSGSTFLAKINQEINASSNTPTDFITKSVLTYESDVLPSKVFKIQNTIDKQYNALENTNNETTTIYDGYNNPTQSTTSLKEGGTIVQTSVSNVGYDNQPAGSNYYIGRPTSKTQSVTTSEETMTSEELYSYTGHLLSQIKKKGHNTTYITEDNLYDPFGNITKKTITAGSNTRVTNHEYDPSGRFLTKSIDIEGLPTTFAYNTSNGLLNSETNPYGLTTSYSYDPWFKKIKTTDYLGKSNGYNYTRSGEKTIITNTGDDDSNTQETFDDLGRKITAGFKDINGNFSTISYLYDIYNRNYKVSEPSFDSNPTQWNETQYDVYGRPIQSISFTGKTTTMGYSGLTTTVNDGVKTKTSTKNAIGNVITMTDSPGGTINYTYFANGNLKATNYDGVLTTIEQDGWGRKTKLIDPSAGAYSYTYNLLGERTSETTPNGTTTYTLDAVGKLIKKTIVGTNTNNETTYNYDTATKLPTSSIFKNNLEGNAITNNTYEYDSYKRLFKTTETTPHATFIKQFTFDAFGRTEKESNTAVALTSGKTSAKTIKNTYKNGSPWQIVDDANSQVLWQTNTTNARGQLMTAAMCNGNIAITNTYDNYGFTSQIKHDRVGVSPGNLMTLNTVFDPKKGNLSSRTNSLFSTNEFFEYDKLDRLTKWADVPELLFNNTFDTTAEGFVAELGATLTPKYGGGTLAVTATNSYSGARKVLMTNAKVGDKLKVKIKANFSSNANIQITIIEEDPTTGLSYQYLKSSNNDGTIEFTHVVLQYSNVAMKIGKGDLNTSPAKPELIKIDNLTVHKIIENLQTYDDRGRITQNAVGDYNYTSTAKPYQNTSVTLTPEATAYYKNREGVFNDGMEEQKGWGAQRHPSEIFFSYDNTKIHTGSNSLKLSNNSTIEQYVNLDKWIAIDNATDTEYTYSAWIYTDNPEAELFLFMKTPTEAGYFTVVNNIATSVKNQWVKIEKTFLIPANIKKLNLRLDNNGLGNVWFDDVQIRKTSNAPLSNATFSDKQLNITYNTFKSTVQIEEAGVDKISFTYNDGNDRSTMFYGGLEDDKLLRQYRKHYSTDGTMEIKQNTATGAVEFVTYIGGDGYSAPIVLKSDGTTQNYLYLHRDYQDSILAITDATGAVLEKRLFDAWGNVTKVQDGADNTLNGLTILDRGYTGHEHLQSVGLIHMNGRLYDPKLHRFLQPDNYVQDPTNTQNYNRYGYVLNNPSKYTDPSGEILGAIFGYLLAAYIHGASASGGELNPAKWNSNGWSNAALGVVSSVASTVATNYANNYIVNYNKPPELGASASSAGSVGNGRSTGHSYVSTKNSSSASQTSGGQHYGGDESGSVLDYFSRFVYETDQFNPIALAWDGIKGHITGSDRYGNELSGFESSMKIVSAVPMTKAASIVTNAGEAAFFNGGKTFTQYKIARGGTETLAHIQTSTGVQRVSTEFHHMFITQRVQRAYNLPNWMVNNRANVFKLNTIQHSLVDSYRYNFLRAGIKPQVGWFGQYNWFTKF